jgi:hypothetical protein
MFCSGHDRCYPLAPVLACPADGVVRVRAASPHRKCPVTKSNRRARAGGQNEGSLHERLLKPSVIERVYSR